MYYPQKKERPTKTDMPDIQYPEEEQKTQK